VHFYGFLSIVRMTLFMGLGNYLSCFHYDSFDIICFGGRWFVWGSFITTVFPILILCNKYIHIYETHNSTLPALGYYVTWIMVLFSGLFFTLGSLAFVRAFEEPPLPPLFKWRHVQTDELLAAWLFMLGTVPALPYSAIWFITYPSQVLYICYIAASGTFVFCTYLFVLACYPSDKVYFFLFYHLIC